MRFHNRSYQVKPREVVSAEVLKLCLFTNQKIGLAASVRHMPDLWPPEQTELEIAITI